MYWEEQTGAIKYFSVYLLIVFFPWNVERFIQNPFHSLVLNPSTVVWLQVAEMYSKVCKTGKKKRAVPGSPPSNPGFRTLGRGDRDGGFSVVVKPQTWAPLEGKAIGGPLDDHCYESIGTEEYDPSYEHMEGGGGWKRERPPNTCATLRPRRKKSQQPLQQQQPPPPPPTQQTPKLQHLPAKALLLPGENLYESIGDLKQGSATSSTTTIFTFNDGMEMYVTGLWGGSCTVTPPPPPPSRPTQGAERTPRGVTAEPLSCSPTHTVYIQVITSGPHRLQRPRGSNVDLLWPGLNTKSSL